MSVGTLPDSISIRGSAIKWLYVLLGLAVLALYALAQETAPDRPGAIAMLAIGVGVLTLRALLVSLHLNRHGFQTRGLFPSRRVKWTDCTHFEVVRFSMASHVAFTQYGISSAPPLPIHKRALSIRHRSYLPHRYDIPAGDLAKLMNQFRDRAFGVGSEA